MASHTTVMIDCRWIGFTGIGKVTDLLLDGLHELSPPGRWILWGPEGIADRCWPGARWVMSSVSPLAWAGQRELLRVPNADQKLFLHAVRPMLGHNCDVLIHDTIPIRWDERLSHRIAMRVLYTASARLARSVFVQSSATEKRVRADLGVTPRRILTWPSDPRRDGHIKDLRGKLSVDPLTMIYVGRVRPHKNIVRALIAYGDSGFRRSGGKFVVVGADRRGQDSIASTVRRIGSDGVTIVPRCSDEELERIYATAGLLIQPSLEEGYGFSVVEALKVGIPVCCSDIDPMNEIARGYAELFDPWSISSIAAAIDSTARRAADGVEVLAPPTPTPREFAQEMLEALAAARS
ncbi:MAG: glycosyltransferase [Acidimicrobiales bacterium]